MQDLFKQIQLNTCIFIGIYWEKKQHFLIIVRMAHLAW